MVVTGESVRFSVTLSAFSRRGMEMEKFLDERTPFRGGDLVDRSVEFAFFVMWVRTRAWVMCELIMN